MAACGEERAALKIPLYIIDIYSKVGETGVGSHMGWLSHSLLLNEEGLAKEDHLHEHLTLSKITCLKCQTKDLHAAVQQGDQKIVFGTQK